MFRVSVRSRTARLANYPALRNDVVWIRFTEPSALEEVHNVCFAGGLLVETVFVLFQTDRSSYDNILATGRKPVVRVVEHNLHCGPCE
jgi:hypothetical protein